MPNIRMLRSVIKEYGIPWIVNRTLYSFKLKSLKAVPLTEKLYERKPAYPKRLDLFHIDIPCLRNHIQSLEAEDKNALIQTADKVCEGIVTAFSAIELDYGNPVNWQLDPLTGKCCDGEMKWYGIPDFDQGRGDIKVIWEASRFSHFITLARAYLLTDNEKYYKVFSFQLRDWLEKNPYGFGANFKCGQECSLRMVNALLAYTVFKASGIAADADASNMKDLVDRCYRKVLSNFFYAHRCIRNNHTLSELMGMIAGAWCCGDQKQLDRAYTWLEEAVDEQFTDDGGYRQFSFNYQRLALQDLECILSIEERTGREISPKIKEKIRNSALLMYQCQDRSGDLPNYGSNDGALVFPVTSCGYRDFRPVINTAYALVTGRQLYDAGKHQEELIWFSGGKALNEYRTRTVDRVPSQFPEAGLFTIRNQNAWAMVILNDYHSRPAHMDQLHFDLWINGINVLCDAGTFSYASEEGKKLGRNESHNTAVLKDVPQMNVYGPFMTYDWTKRELIKWEADCFEGRCISANGYTHTRKVNLAGTSYVIRDCVNRDFDLLFHTPCEVTTDDGKAILSLSGRKLCEIQCNCEMKLHESQRSIYYMKKEKTTCIAIKGQTGKEIVTKIEIPGGSMEK